MNKERAISIAHAEANLKGWSWVGQVDATCARKWLLFGPRQWSVRSNTDGRGTNVFVL